MKRSGSPLISALLAAALMGSALPSPAQEETHADHSAGATGLSSYIPGEVLVRYRALEGGAAEKAAAAQLVEQRFALEKLSDAPVLDATLYRIGDGRDPHDIAAELSKEPEVAGAQPQYIYYPAMTPNDPSYANVRIGGREFPNSLQRWVYNGVTRRRARDVNVNGEAAWDLTTGRPDVVIAVVDSGVLLDHPDLGENIWRNPFEIPGNGIDDDGNHYVDDVNGWDFRGDANTIHTPSKPDNDPNPDLGDKLDNDGDGGRDNFAHHGTFVAGIAAARGNNGIDIAGASWNCRIMPVKVFADDGPTTSRDVAEAIYYAADNGASVINVSIFGFGGNDAAVRGAVRYAVALGVVVVACAGNDNTAEPTFPASFENVLSVGATRFAGDFTGLPSGGPSAIRKRAPFSQFGPAAVDVVAPGEVFGLSFTSRAQESLDGQAAGTPLVTSNAGTSFAAPLVAGLAALMISYARDRGGVITNTQIADIIQNTATDLGDDPTDSPDGGADWDNHGRVNMRAALDAVAALRLPRQQVWSGNDTTSLNSKLQEFVRAGGSIKSVAQFPNGGWAILATNGYFASGIPQDAFEAIETLAAEGRDVKRITATPGGGWAILFDRNGLWGRDVPRSTFQSIMSLQQRGAQIDALAFDPSGLWVIVSDDGRGFTGSMPDALRDALISIRDQGHPIKDVAFAPDGTFTVLFADWGVFCTSPWGFSSLLRLAKQGQHHQRIAFSPTYEWTVMVGR
jgi:subtilisin family serine protease